jgi:hypothetical protein
MQSEPTPGPDTRFDGETVRRILQRAAEAQHHLDNALADACTLPELEEMAAEARISPAALHAAIAAERDHGADTGTGARARRAALMSIGFVVLSGVLIALAMIAPVVFWGATLSLVALSMLVLLESLPF